MENYHEVDIEKYYRRGPYEHFSAVKCSTSMTNRIDVTNLYNSAKSNGRRFYIDVLYLISKTLNSREDYRLFYNYQNNKLLCFDKINPTHYVFFEESETCTPCYSEYFEDYDKFKSGVEADSAKAREKGVYDLQEQTHPNWFDASCNKWLSYESMSLELPDGYLYFNPIVVWGSYRREDNGRLTMPISIRLNHAVADGYLIAKFFITFEKEMNEFIAKYN